MKLSPFIFLVCALCATGCNVFYIAGAQDGVEVSADLNNVTMRIERLKDDTGEVAQDQTPIGASFHVEF